MIDFYVEGRKIVGNRETQNIFWNSKYLSDFDSCGSLNCVYLKKFMNLWSFEIITSLFDDKFL